MPPKFLILLQALTGQIRYCMYCDLRTYLSDIIRAIQAIDSATAKFTTEQHEIDKFSYPQLIVSSLLLSKPVTHFSLKNLTYSRRLRMHVVFLISEIRSLVGS